MHNVLSSAVFPDPRLPVAGERLEVVADVAPHSHAFFEIAVVVAGRGTHVSAAGEVALAPDSVVVLRPGEWHGYVDCEDLVVRNAYLGPDVFGLLSGALVPGSLRAPAHPAVQHAMRLLEADLAEPWTPRPTRGPREPRARVPDPALRQVGRPVPDGLPEPHPRRARRRSPDRDRATDQHDRNHGRLARPEPRHPKIPLSIRTQPLPVQIRFQTVTPSPLLLPSQCMSAFKP